MYLCTQDYHYCQRYMKRLLTIVIILQSLVCASAQTGLFFASDRLSSTIITSICQDKAGFIWIGTEHGLNRFDGYRFTAYLNNPADTTSLLYNVVACIYADRDGQLWVGTSKGLQRYNYATDHFDNFHFPDGNQPRVNDIRQMRDGRLLVGTAGYGLYELNQPAGRLDYIDDFAATADDAYFSHIYEDAAGRFWKSGTGSLTCRHPNGKLQDFDLTYSTPSSFFDFNGKPVIVCRDNFLTYEDGRLVVPNFDFSALAGRQVGFRTAYKDRQGNIYVGTRGDGLYWIPAGTRRLVRHPASVQGFDMNATKIWAITEDRQGNLWVGCQQKGLLMIPNRKAQFSSWSFSAQKVDIGTHVSSVCEGDAGLTWVTVQSKGVYAFDSVGRLAAHPSAPSDVEFIYRDRQQAYWLGTSHGVFSYDPPSGRSQLLSDFDCDKFVDMTDDGNGHLFISAYAEGVLMYDRATRSFRHFTMNAPSDTLRGRLCNDWVVTLTADHDGRVWMGTSSGVCCYDPAADSFRPFGWSVINDSRLCNALCETHDGDMLIGTEQGLYVWRRRQNELEVFPHSEPLQQQAISYIVQDNGGDIWCSTSMGIWHYHASEERWVSYVNGSGLSVHEYVYNSGLHTDDDRIAFATSDGLTIFTPRQVHDVQPDEGEIRLTGFYIAGRAASTLTTSGGRSVTDRPVTESTHFRVSYLEGTFSLEFSLLNYSNAGNTIFEYRLDDARQWTRNPEGRNAIVFNHLPSGTYKLEVRAIDNGVTSPSAVYTITVTPPWYRTPLAYFLYFLLLLAVVGFIVWVWRRHMRQQLDEDKMKFLINATHDIRSPLTLILSPLEKLRRRELDDASRVDLEVIDRNAQRILTLVNQILDVRKIDKQQMHLHCRETDLCEFIRVIYKVYEYNARERGINFTFTHPDHPVRAWVDRTQFDKVVSNLLSNAFKFTFDQGDINIDLRAPSNLPQLGEAAAPEASAAKASPSGGRLEGAAVITVTDNGTGMRDDTVQHIFDRFYQGKTAGSAHIEGTGIGLNLCKMIVDMHHGTIQAHNRQDGVKGSQFIVTLPLGHAHLSPAEIDAQPEQPAAQKLTAPRQPRSNYHVLIVDDDEEIGRYIGHELGAYYHFAVCHNGKDGLKELLTNPYDVVVSDVMMPEMDGFTMLRLLKSNVNISHIPVIMLTSKTDVGNRLEGLEKGADAYLTKPFSMDELHLTIDNLIANHLRLKGKFSGAQQPTDRVEAPDLKGNDEQLMERIMKSINAHLSDSDYNVDTLCDEVGISRAHLHRKMKDMTGIPVSEFIRNLRLEQAARMLREQKLNITQVAYAVGFSNLGYFSTVFRKHFGISPREFVEQQ